MNAYFHIDRAQTRLQMLGITSANAEAQEVIADGQQADNSYFDPMKDIINYGQGGIGDAEDADIVLHEYGHAIQEDQVPGWGASSEAGAMGEGFGDYLAVSLNRLLSQQVNDPPASPSGTPASTPEAVSAAPTA
ncbi:MAG: M36 family metallopeptidase [Polyangiaceae bacterium]